MTNTQYRPRRVARHSDHQVRGIRYRLHEWGDAGQPVMLLLHGWGDTGATFQFLVDEFEANWHVLAPDWRGFGDSARNSGAYWFPDYLADLHDLLRNLELQDPVPIVGHSMGGNIAALYAGVFPDAVSRLVNIEGFGLPDSDPADAPDRYRRWVRDMTGSRQHPGYATLAPLQARIRERSPQLDDERAAFIAECWTERDARGRYRLKADDAHRWSNAVLYRRAEAEACWRRIAAPVLLLSGAESDFTAGIRDWSRPAAELPYPDAQHVAVTHAGHMLHFEQPAAVAALIEDFLQ